MLLGFECTINPQNLIKIVRTIFEKFDIFNFFLMWTTLNFMGRGETKKTARDIYMRTLYIEFEWDRSIGLGSTFGDGHADRQTDGRTDGRTDTHTHTQTFFLKHIFRLCEISYFAATKKLKMINLYINLFISYLIVSVKLNCFSSKKQKIKRRLHWLMRAWKNHGRLARFIKWRACDVEEAKEGLENELWRR